MKIKILALLVTGLVTASCQTADLNATLDKACATLNTVYAAFTAATVSGSISEKTVQKVDAAYTSSAILCTTPVTNSSDAIVRVTLTVATITKAFKEIK